VIVATVFLELDSDLFENENEKFINIGHLLFEIKSGHLISL